MRKLKTFKTFRVNEELFHGNVNNVGQQGGAGTKSFGSLMNKAGSFFGHTGSILQRYLDEKVSSGQITEPQSGRIKDQIDIDGVEKNKIQNLVDKHIELISCLQKVEDSGRLSFQEAFRLYPYLSTKIKNMEMSKICDLVDSNIESDGEAEVDGWRTY